MKLFFKKILLTLFLLVGFAVGVFLIEVFIPTKVVAITVCVALSIAIIIFLYIVATIIIEK